VNGIIFATNNTSTFVDFEAVMNQSQDLTIRGLNFRSHAPKSRAYSTGIRAVRHTQH